MKKKSKIILTDSKNPVNSYKRGRHLNKAATSRPVSKRKEDESNDGKY